MERSESKLLGDDFWRQYAASYDRILPLMPFYQLATRRHLEAIADAGARQVLDVGCGTGNVAVPAAFAGANVVAIDRCPSMLARLREKAKGFGVEARLDVVEQDAETLPETLDACQFDVANFLLSLFCLSHGRQVLAAAVRSVRKGGLILLTEPTREFQEQPLLALGQQVIFERLKRTELEPDWEVVRGAGKRLGGCIRDAAPGRGETKLRSNDLPSALAELGCQVLAIKDSHLGQCQFILACVT